ncbi:hypothetical protein J9A90_03615 [Klebsiella pneumoniae]|nr:hypothetical protein [Klebsiella pneumoniae]EKU0342497.1 hypothetical protein [Klebsiella pneumoniae]EKU4485502.1 hypothetical protein [Klebsiella pneumoniae]EKU5877597.1 hypothetical protein [Klebsiella pneumoniae]EKU5895898.1 hypothetical protein [Klebsiella pneumoniae]EKV3294977.1 hypothetical protein [Klebsiella pneumoniae]
MIKLLGSESYISEKNDELSSRNFVGFSISTKTQADSSVTLLDTFNGNAAGLSVGQESNGAVTKIESDTIGLYHSAEAAKIGDRIYNSFTLDSFELGYESKTFYLVNELIESYGHEFIDSVLTQLMRKHIISCNNPVLMCKFLTFLTEFDADVISMTSAYSITSFSHKKYNSVKEMVLISIELWKSKDALNLLEDMEPYQRRSLEVYRLKIINMLKGL